jgi:hypothetical protein
MTARQSLYAVLCMRVVFVAELTMCTCARGKGSAWAREKPNEGAYPFEEEQRDQDLADKVERDARDHAGGT